MNVLPTTVSSADGGPWSRSRSTQHDDQQPTLGAAVATIAAMLRPDDERLTNDDIDALQHLSLDTPDTDVLRSVLGSMNLAEAPSWIRQQQWDRRWAALLKGMALCPGLHDPTISLGEALARADWPEDRFTRMMEAPPTQTLTHVEWAARHFARANQKVNWDDVRRLLFKSGEHAKQLRLRVANDYFRTVYALRRRS
jgi:CRISPR type I-E-associated protein CasB/Cse2